MTQSYTKHVLHLYRSSSFIIRPLTILLSTGLIINGQFRKIQPIYVPFHGRRRISNTSSLTRRSTSITSMNALMDLARTIQAQAGDVSPFTSANKVIEQTANEVLSKSNIKQEGATRKRLLPHPTNIEGEKPSTSELRVDDAGHSEIINHMTRLMTSAVKQMYSILRVSPPPMLEAQSHYKSKINNFDSNSYLRIADPRFGVHMLAAWAMASDIRDYSVISRSSDVDELLTGAPAGDTIALSTSINPIFLDALGFQAQNNSIINSIVKKLQPHLAPSTATHASFSLAARFNQMLVGSTLNLHPSLADSIITEKNLFSRLLDIYDRPFQAQNTKIKSINKILQTQLAPSAETQASFPLADNFDQLLPWRALNLHPSLADSILVDKKLFSRLVGIFDSGYQLSNRLHSRTVPILRSRDRLLPIVTNLDRLIITKGRFQFDNNVYSTLLSRDNWMMIVMSNLVRSMSRPASGTYTIEPQVLESIGVASALIRRKSSHVSKQISNPLSFDNSSHVNIIPAFTQFTKPGHKIFGHARDLLKYGTKQSDYLKIPTINQVKKLFELSNLVIQEPLQVLRASNVSTRRANIISPTLNFFGARSKSEYWNILQKVENAYTYHISVASSKSSAPIEKLIEISASHVILDSTIASPLSVNVQTSSVGSLDTIAHRFKSQKQFQQIKSNNDYRLTDSIINSNPIKKDFVLSSDHAIQPTNFVEELKGSSNHDKDLEEIGRELQQDSELRYLRARIEHIFNRETSRHGDSQRTISLTSQYSLKYNDILDENAVPDGNDGQHDEEMEIRSLTRKIEQVFDEELRRYGPIIW